MRCHNHPNRRRFLKTLGGAILSGTFLPVSASISGYFTDKSIMREIKPGDRFEPAYLKLHQDGSLKARARLLWDKLRDCDLCPRECYKNRIRGQKGDCNASAQLEISSCAPHFGEETELVGRNGSGTVFFTNCALLCVFCINYDISQMGKGRRHTIDDLATMMLSLQRIGCHNINLVSPTHYSPHILMALDIAASKGLRLPIAYNTFGWEKTEVLQFLDGVVDIYLADFKYDDAIAADKYSPGAVTYPDITKTALLEMNRQVGVARADTTGLIKRGLMIRHLVMPNNVAKSERIMQWIGQNLPPDTYVNIMSQYTPVFKADQFPEINRRITLAEYNTVLTAAEKAGLRNYRRQG
jgi:putative pyruvate formate lyase activating enzyme